MPTIPPPMITTSSLLLVIVLCPFSLPTLLLGDSSPFPTPPSLPLHYPPHPKEQQQGMLRNGKCAIGIRDWRTYGCERYGKKVIIGPLRMCQKIDQAMREHADKAWERRFIEHI